MKNPSKYVISVRSIMILTNLMVTKTTILVYWKWVGLWFNGPVNTYKISSWSVYLTTFILGRLILQVVNQYLRKFFCQKLTIAPLESET